MIIFTFIDGIFDLNVINLIVATICFTLVTMVVYASMIFAAGFAAAVINNR